MDQPRIQLRNPVVAAVLAYLIPGAGHLYQRRYFKGVLYFLCIVGTFLSGMALGEWKVVYFRRDAQETSYGYFAQVLVGLPALPALLQFRRAQSPGNEPQVSLSEPLFAPFEGLWDLTAEPVRISGTVQLTPSRSELGAPRVEGKFTGTKADGSAVEIPISGRIEMDPPIMADSRRLLFITLDGGRGGLHGAIPRPFWNWFEVPASDEILQDLNGRLGKYLELAKVFTWIAGLLNILAIWDALEGPAYGYGDEEEEPDEREKRKDPDEQPQKQPV